MSDYNAKCKNSLPIIFDDNMPVTNLTPKIVNRVNNNTEDLKNLYDETESQAEDIETLQEDLEGKIDVPQAAGTSGQVLTSDGEGGVVWAEVGAGEIVVDPTLTVEGAAADAKVTGDEITAIKTDLTQAEALTAPAFSTATNYTSGQYVTYNDALYRFTQNHAAGAWNSAHVTAVDVAEVLEDFETRKANIDGSYEQMTVGNAEQLVSSIKEEDKVPYVFRTSGGSIDIGDREEDKIIGGTVAWNQLVNPSNIATTKTENGVTFTKNNDGSVTVSTSGAATATTFFDVIPVKSLPVHKYFLKGCPSGGSDSEYSLRMRGQGGDCIDNGNGAIWNATNNAYKGMVIRVASGATISTAITFKPQLYDLTQMFGSTIADYIYSLEQAHAGDGVAWFRKLFSKDYYAYDAGTLKHVSGLVSHDMVGFNQWDEEWEVGTISSGVPAFANNAIRSKNFNKCIGGATYFMTCGKTDGGNQNKYYLAMVFYDANKTYIKSIYNNNGTAVAPENAAYFKVITNTSTVVYGNTYNHDICINLSWDGSRNGEYEPYQKWTYPLDSSLTLRGIPKLDSNNQLYYDGDEYASDGTVTRRYGIVDLGTLAWRKANTSFITTDLNGIINPPATIATYPTVLLSKGKYILKSSNADSGVSGTYEFVVASSGQITYRYPQDGIADGTAFANLMSGTYMIYPLATLTTEEADPYQNPQIVDDFGTEEYVIDNTVTVPIPVGHDTFYQANLVAKLEMAPNSPEGDGDYIVRQTNGENAYVPITFPADELPAAPTTDGNYVLKCTVASGTATFTWEAQS